jgi:rsbT co-antagonist protein RsbR
MIELAEIISKNEDKIRAEWIKDIAASVQRADLISKAELDEQCRSLLGAVVAGVRVSGPNDLSAAGWNSTRELLQEMSASRARQGLFCATCSTCPG